MKIEWIIPLALLTGVLLSCHDNNHATQVPDTANQPTDTVIATPGQLLFQQKCAACHGGDGTAGIGNAANLQTSRLDSGAITKLITNGRNNMPAFASQLTPEQTNELASYILTLRK